MAASFLVRSDINRDATLMDDNMSKLDEPPRYARSAARKILPIALIYRENVKRAEHLVGIYRKLYGKGGGRRHVAHSDLLRAAVVLMHATLEDMLRGLCMSYWPKSGREILNKVPLQGMNFHGKAEKFYLGDLVQFRELTVDELIGRSVQSHLERSSFSDTDELCGVLVDCGFEVSKNLKGHLPDLQELMIRRHQIVHRADLLRTRQRGKQIAASLSVTTIYRWLTAMYEFLVEISAQIISREKMAFLNEHTRTNEDARLVADLQKIENEAKLAGEGTKIALASTD